MVIAMGDAFSVKKNPKHYPLTTDKARHVGDPVAILVAEDPYIAADAVRAIIVEYDPLPVVVDAEAALKADAPLVHDEWEDNLAFRWSTSGGDVEAAFAQAETVVEYRFVNQRLIGNAIEPRGVLADYNPQTESLTVWASTQIPHFVQSCLAGILGMPKEKVRVITPEVGGGFGVKGNVYGEDVLASYMARLLGRPVKWIATRSEDYLSTIQGRGQIDIVRLAADRTGRVQAVDLKIITDCGAYYSRITPIIAPLTANLMTGNYAIPHARAEVLGVFTNKLPKEPYRGAGRPEATYLIERAMDMLARELDLDAAEVRRRNFIPPQDFPYTTPTNVTYDSGEYERALDKALELVDYQGLRAEQARQRAHARARGKLIGLGLACYVEICGFGPWEAGGVTVDEQGQVTVLSGASPQGQGHETSWAQIAADVLQIPLDDITVKHGDTAVVPRGIGTFGSRSAAVGGSAIFENSETVRERARQIAAHLLEAADVDITLQDGRFQVIGVPDRSLGWQEIAQAAYGEALPQELRGALSADVDYKPKGETFPFGVHVCVVEIDRDTGAVRIVRYLSVDDCGYVINPMLVDGQVHGGIAQGVGQALFEHALYDDTGNLVSGTLMDYALPRADNFPIYETNRTETPSPLNPLGVKGIGEAATIAATPTVVNAVVDALSHMGVRHLDMPLTPEKIWWAMRGAQKDF